MTARDARERRDDSRLEFEDRQYCKECGIEIEVDTEGFNGFRWDSDEGEWVEIERCAACYAEEVLRKVSQLYETNVAFRATVRGLDVETEVLR